MLLQVQLCFPERLLQAFEPHRFGQVVLHRQLEGLHGMFGVGRHEHHGRGRLQTAQVRRQT